MIKVKRQDLNSTCSVPDVDIFVRHSAPKLSCISFKYEAVPHTASSPVFTLFTAEAERFELSIPCGMPPFQGGGINHYPTPPCVQYNNLFVQKIKNGMLRGNDKASLPHHY